MALNPSVEKFILEEDEAYPYYYVYTESYVKEIFAEDGANFKHYMRSLESTNDIAASSLLQELFTLRKREKEITTELRKIMGYV